jgi:Arc/MetJ-type ribon-helix-helix transcriptional regulator
MIKTYGNMIQATMYLPNPVHDKLEQMKAEGIFESKSEVYRIAIKEYLIHLKNNQEKLGIKREDDNVQEV